MGLKKAAGIILVAIIIGITWVQVVPSKDAAHRSAACEQLDVLRTAIDEYGADHGGEYPPSTNDYQQLLTQLEPYLPASNPTPGYSAFRNRESVWYERSEDGANFRVIAMSLSSRPNMVMATSRSYARPISNEDAEVFLASDR